MRVDYSQAPGAFAHDIDAFLAFIGLERGLSPNTIAAYRRDLDQAATFLARSKVTDWRGVTPRRPTSRGCSRACKPASPSLR